MPGVMWMRCSGGVSMIARIAMISWSRCVIFMRPDGMRPG